MLYRVEPNTNVTWADYPLSLIDQLEREGHVIDLDRLDWQESEQPYALILKLALRYGKPTRAGIVVEARYVSKVTRPALLRKTYGDLVAHRESEGYKRAEAHANAAVEIMFGKGVEWERYGRELDAQLDESHRQSVSEADEDARQVLSQPCDETLMEHWRAIGGVGADA